MSVLKGQPIPFFHAESVKSVIFDAVLSDGFFQVFAKHGLFLGVLIVLVPAVVALGFVVELHPLALAARARNPVRSEVRLGHGPENRAGAAVLALTIDQMPEGGQIVGVRQIRVADRLTLVG